MSNSNSSQNGAGLPEEAQPVPGPSNNNDGGQYLTAEEIQQLKSRMTALEDRLNELLIEDVRRQNSREAEGTNTPLNRNIGVATSSASTSASQPSSSLVDSVSSVPDSSAVSSGSEPTSSLDSVSMVPESPTVSSVTTGASGTSSENAQEMDSPRQRRRSSLRLSTIVNESHQDEDFLTPSELLAFVIWAVENPNKENLCNAAELLIGAIEKLLTENQNLKRLANITIDRHRDDYAQRLITVARHDMRHSCPAQLASTVLEQVEEVDRLLQEFNALQVNVRQISNQDHERSSDASVQSPGDSGVGGQMADQPSFENDEGQGAGGRALEDVEFPQPEPTRDTEDHVETMWEAVELPVDNSNIPTLMVKDRGLVSRMETPKEKQPDGWRQRCVFKGPLDAAFTSSTCFGVLSGSEVHLHSFASGSTACFYKALECLSPCTVFTGKGRTVVIASECSITFINMTDVQESSAAVCSVKTINLEQPVLGINISYLKDKRLLYNAFCASGILSFREDKLNYTMSSCLFHRLHGGLNVKVFAYSTSDTQGGIIDSRGGIRVFNFEEDTNITDTEVGNLPRNQTGKLLIVAENVVFALTHENVLYKITFTPSSITEEIGNDVVDICWLHWTKCFMWQQLLLVIRKENSDHTMDCFQIKKNGKQKNPMERLRLPQALSYTFTNKISFKVSAAPTVDLLKGGENQTELLTMTIKT